MLATTGTAPRNDLLLKIERYPYNNNGTVVMVIDQSRIVNRSFPFITVPRKCSAA